MSEIRRATVADLDAVMALETASFPTDAWSSDLMRAEITGGHTTYLVLEDEGAVVGYAGLRALAGDPDADVQTIAIAQGRRGRGDGRRLLHALMRIAVDAGAARIFLDVRDDNAPARGLYAAEGFVEIGRRPHYYQPDDVDAVVMRVDLTPAVKEKLA